MRTGFMKLGNKLNHLISFVWICDYSIPSVANNTACIHSTDELFSDLDEQPICLWNLNIIVFVAVARVASRRIVINDFWYRCVCASHHSRKNSYRFGSGFVDENCGRQGQCSTRVCPDKNEYGSTLNAHVRVHCMCLTAAHIVISFMRAAANNLFHWLSVPPNGSNLTRSTNRTICEYQTGRHTHESFAMFRFNRIFRKSKEHFVFQLNGKTPQNVLRCPSFAHTVVLVGLAAHKNWNDRFVCSETHFYMAAFRMCTCNRCHHRPRDEKPISFFIHISGKW